MKTRAFTLAEVLITLAIIGVVAAMTIPTLISKYQEKATVTTVKNSFSILSNAVQLAKAEKGDYTGTTTQEFYDYISPYLKIAKYCGTGSGCWANTTIKFLHGDDWINIDTYPYYLKAALNNGTSLQLFGQYSDHKAEIRVDVNGKSGPNTEGKDVFSFRMINNVIYPQPLPAEPDVLEEKFRNYCNLESPIDYNGLRCTAWVIYKGNMDYLKCNDLSWNGKSKCD